MGVTAFPAKYSAPTAARKKPRAFAAQRVRDEPLMLFAAPPGYLDPVDVAAVVGCEAVWIWLDEFDDDPTSLLSSIADGVCRRVGPSALPSSVGTVVRTFEDVGSRGIESFGEELEDVLATRPLVLSSPSRAVGERALAMLCEGLFPAMGPLGRVVVVTCHFGDMDRLCGAPVVGVGDLRVCTEEIEAFAVGFESVLPGELVRRAARLTEGRGATLASVLLAGSLLGPDAFGRAVKGAENLGGLLTTLIELSLIGVPPDVLGSLEVVSRLGFTHPRLIEAAVGQRSLVGASWLLTLEDDWALADPLWRHALADTLRPGLSSDALGRIAGELVDEGAPELALPLCREAGDVRGLARCLDEIAQRPNAARRWEVLQGELFGGVKDAPAAPRRRRRFSRLFRPHDSVDSRPPVVTQCADPWLELVRPPAERTAPACAADGPPVAQLDPGGRSVCEARLLGSFELSVDGSTVEEWAGTRGRSVLKYLLVHRDRPVRKETLMETFWPGGDPDASRNCLNVAVSSLRRSLRPLLGDVPVVLHHEGSYRFNPAIDVSVDVDQFEADATEGLAQYRNGDLAAATVALTNAARLYRGAFLEDDPFEEWASPARERLRVRFLDVLDRLSEIAFVQGRYDACIEVGHRILREDSCREDTQRLLMRCHSRQGRWHLGLRQYHSCVESLKVELSVEPAGETVALYEDIRQHRHV